VRHGRGFVESLFAGGVVAIRVQNRAERSRIDDQHVPDDENIGTSGMMASVARDQAGRSLDVVIHDHHNVSGGSLNARRPRPGLALVGDVRRHEAWLFPSEFEQKFARTIVRAADDHDELGQRRIVEQRSQQPRKKLSSV
jgi:hypothetical protein